MIRGHSDRTDRGVSEVLGVVLMVGITVLLAATSAAFFFGIQDGELGDGAPTVAFDEDYSQDEGSHVLRIRHAGGDPVAPGALRFVVADATCSAGDDPHPRYTTRGLGTTDSRISAGSRFVLSKAALCGPGGGTLDLSAAEVTVVWMGDDGTTSMTLWRWRGPAA